jgi:DNA polymerase
MFVGEGPGAEEDRQGRPFVGRAGQLLTKMIEAMGLKREEVYIANIVKCRPPDNRNPFREEATACIDYLKKQIELVSPKVIVCLGSVAATYLLNTEKQISKLRGEFVDFNGIKVMPTFHPAYLLRNPSKKKEAWEDLKKVINFLNLK